MGKPTTTETWNKVAALVAKEGVEPIPGKITVREKAGMQKDGRVVVKDGYTWLMGNDEAMRTLERQEKEEEVQLQGLLAYASG